METGITDEQCDALRRVGMTAENTGGGWEDRIGCPWVQAFGYVPGEIGRAARNFASGYDKAMINWHKGQPDYTSDNLGLGIDTFDRKIV
jgi:hypothetical protein